MNEYTTLITSNLGISNQLFWWVGIVCASLFLSLVANMVLGSPTLAMLIMPIPFLVGVVFGYIPMWIGFMLLIPFLYTLFMAGEQIAPENLKPYWEQYGDDLKNAYASKFGGENPAFNQEVDNHVAIMINNGKGFTRSLANDWMKRMGKFTECK